MSGDWFLLASMHNNNSTSSSHLSKRGNHNWYESIKIYVGHVNSFVMASSKSPRYPIVTMSLNDPNINNL